MLNLSLENEDFDIDLGKAYLYSGAYDIPYFFESASKKMMRPPGPKVISFKTIDNSFILQFALDNYHGKKCILITSTEGDCAFILGTKLSITGMKEWASAKSDNKHPINGSFSGYFTFGRRLLKQYETLEKHLKEHELSVSDESLELIWTELNRRAKYE